MPNDNQTTSESPSCDAACSVMYDETPVCRILNALNRECVKAGKRQDAGEARRIAYVATQLENAVLEYRKFITQNAKDLARRALDSE